VSLEDGILSIKCAPCSSSDLGVLKRETNGGVAARGEATS